MNRTIKGFCILVFLFCVGLPKLEVRLKAANANPGDPIPTGDIRSEQGFYSVVFYYAPDPAADTRATAEALSKKLLPGTAFSTDAGHPPKAPFIGFEEERGPLHNFPVPSSSYFRHAGRGLTTDDIVAFQKTSLATRLVLVVPKELVWSLGRQFTDLVQQFAEATKAYVWDSATRECFSRDAWKKRRLSSWPATGVPDITRQFTIHLYRPDDNSSYLRAVTLGMEKFALPDVVVEHLIGSDNRPCGNLINLVCQSLAENPVIKNSAKAVFSLRKLGEKSLQEKMQSSLKTNATQTITLALLEGRHDEGDSHNQLVEISFQNGVGKTDDERREDLLAKLWGAEDSMVGVRQTGAILEASKRARRKLAGLRPAFEKGLPPGSRLLVKSPFARDDQGNEYMWVEVMRWPTQDELEGVLQNDPYFIRKLKAGAHVKVAFDSVFDYLLYHGDGTKEGNETAALIQMQGGPTIPKPHDE